MNFCYDNNKCRHNDYSDYVIGSSTPIKTDYGCSPRIFFDNGATTLISRDVEDKINSLYCNYTYTDLLNYNSNFITEQYNKTREIVKRFLGADMYNDTAIFIKNSTFGMNIFANAIAQVDPYQVVLSTKMEHLANYLPYSERLNTKLIGILPNGDIDLDDYRRLLELYKGRVKFVCVTAATNVTGIVTPYYTMARMAHEYGAKIFLDIVQLLQHKPFDMKPAYDPEHIDFVAFSAHKVYTGFDGGALVGPAAFFNQYLPLEYGAGITKFVNNKQVIFDDSPDKYEPGYPNVLPLIALGTSLESLESIGMYKIAQIESELYSHLMQGLRSFPNIILYGASEYLDHIPFVAFNFKGIKPDDICAKLGYEYGIESASGTIGANIYVQTLLGLTDEEAYELYLNKIKYGVMRISMAFYNTHEEIDRFLNALRCVVNELS